MSSPSIEDLKARLDVCRQQLEGNSLLNTAKRKDALREEIKGLEMQIAQVLGLTDDEDEDDYEDDDSGASAGQLVQGGDIDTPESAHLPPISSPGVTRSPSPVLMNPAKKIKVERNDSEIETPPISHLHITNDNNNINTTSSDFSSLGASSIRTNEVESVRSALVDAGEGYLDLETLLKEQAMMEQRHADMKRRREEEDEALARSIQEEEFQTFQRRSALSIAPSSSSTSAKSLTQSRLDRARQEREDAEMARIFAESDTSASINLTASSQKTSQMGGNSMSSANPGYPVFHIFDKKTIKETNTAPPPVLSNPGLTSLLPLLKNTNHNPASVDHISTLASVAERSLRLPQFSAFHAAHQMTQQSASQQKPQIDLTKPVIDLTNQDRDASDDEVQYISSSQGSNWVYNNPLIQQYQNISSALNNYRGYYSDRSHDDEFDEDEDDERVYSQWEREVLSSWNNSNNSNRLGYARNLSSTETEKELRDLLANVQAAEEDIPPQDRTGTPDGMASSIVLLEHQKIGLTWLQKMEGGTNRGGILGDDMGLGKTIQTMALIVSRPCGPIDDPVIWDDSKFYNEPPPESALIKTKATLVLAPVSLMHQWAEELRSKTQPGLLKVYVYHGKDKFNDPELLRRYDVIITTVTTLAGDAGVKDVNPAKCRPIGTLFKAHFHRVVIDEAHLIKNRTTKSAKACSMLSSTYRWCLTGTPIQNSIDELYSLIRFLRIKPYCDWDEFRTKISLPMKRSHQYKRTMDRVQVLMKAICLRRTKTCKVDGKPILNLPDRRVDRVATEFSLDERAFYEALETRTRERFNAYVRAGTVMNNYSNILVLLLRLRQACCHPHLINDFVKAMDEETPNDVKAHVDRLLDSLLDDVRHRLIERGLDAVECPICMDVGEESVILSACGHIYCRACIIAHLSRHDEDDRKCPECRRAAPIDNLISIADFNARFNPPVPEDPKGKGKALDQDDDPLTEKLPSVEVPEALNEWISSSKIDKMIEIVKSVMAQGEKIIVFSQFTSLLTLIEKPLMNERINYLRYDGSMTPDKRNEAVRRMINDPTHQVMLISLKCGSLGLNLTVANHVVIMDPWWNPSLENQAIDRVHRIGQTKNVRVHRLCIPNTVEDRIIALQEKKKALADGALGEGEVPKLAKLGLQELMYLFRGE
ncbi:hypothetical protein BGX26_002651 [Mortierella sp. AD094]|nr:hypothetical protein BGX26_002651 [Mortierella sp. AD094]